MKILHQDHSEAKRRPPLFAIAERRRLGARQSQDGTHSLLPLTKLWLRCGTRGCQEFFSDMRISDLALWTEIERERGPAT